MPLVRQFRGRLVKRTRRRGRRITVIFENVVPGRVGEKVVVPLGLFLRQRTIYFTPPAAAAEPTP